MQCIASGHDADVVGGVEVHMGRIGIVVEIARMRS
jgi:hypothetical protein